MSSGYIMSVEILNTYREPQRIEFEIVDTLTDAAKWLAGPPDAILRKIDRLDRDRREYIHLTARQPTLYKADGHSYDRVCSFRSICHFASDGVDMDVDVICDVTGVYDSDHVGDLRYARTPRYCGIHSQFNLDEWMTKDNGEVLLTTCGKSGVNLCRPHAVVAACAVARTTLHMADRISSKPRELIDTIELWVVGEADIYTIKRLDDEVRGLSWADESPDRSTCRRASEVTRVVAAMCHERSARQTPPVQVCCYGRGINGSKRSILLNAANIVREHIKLPDVCWAAILETYRRYGSLL